MSWDDFNPTLTNPGTGEEFSALHFAAMNGYRSMPIIQYYQQEIKFTEFQDSGPHDINPLDKEKSYTPMILATMRGNMDVVMYYMMNLNEKVWNRKTDPEIELLKNSTLLHVAALVGNSQIFQLLIRNVTEKMPIDGGGRNPLHFSALKGHFNVSKILLDYLKVA